MKARGRLLFVLYNLMTQTCQLAFLVFLLWQSPANVINNVSETLQDFQRKQLNATVKARGRLSSVLYNLMTQTCQLAFLVFLLWQPPTTVINIITRHVTVVMQLANPDILDRSIFHDIARSASPILHDTDRTLTPSSTKKKEWKKVLVA